MAHNATLYHNCCLIDFLAPISLRDPRQSLSVAVLQITAHYHPVPTRWDHPWLAASAAERR